MLRRSWNPTVPRGPSLRIAAVLLGIFFVGCDSMTGFEAGPAPAIVLFIGDGMGNGAIEAARLAHGPLAIEALPLRGLVTTGSASHDITDSGAAATALATGVLTYNGAIGVDSTRVPVRTVLELAEERGWATGLVTTSSVTHATAAAFAAHVASRQAQQDIALQMALSGVDVLLGGGRRYFTPATRPDGLDLVEIFRGRGCEVWMEAPGSGPALPECVLGLFAEEHLPPAGARGVSLRELTLRALDILSADPDGLFVMVEGSQIDWAAHANDGPALLAEMRDFDEAVEVAVSYLAGRPGAVLIVTADHETGGLSVGAATAGDSVAFAWSTTGHTAAAVPLFGTGAGLEELEGDLRIDAVGRYLLRQIER